MMPRDMDNVQLTLTAALLCLTKTAGGGGEGQLSVNEAEVAQCGASGQAGLQSLWLYRWTQGIVIYIRIMVICGLYKHGSRPINVLIISRWTGGKLR